MLKKVTTFYLEMTDIKELKPKNGFKEILDIKPVSGNIFQYWMMFVGVGSHVRWYSRLKWSIEEWEQYLSITDTQMFLAFSDKHLVGYFELEKVNNTVEIKFLGLFPDYINVGFGGALLSYALQTAWNMKPEKVWLHTCTVDHKNALFNYIARGLKIVNETDEEEDIPEKEEYLALACQFINQYITKISADWNE